MNKNKENKVSSLKEEEDALKPSSVLPIKSIKTRLNRPYASYKYSLNKFREDREKFLLCQVGHNKMLGIGASELGILLSSPYEIFKAKVLGIKKTYNKEMLYKFEDAKDSESRILKRFLDSEVNNYDIREVSLNKYKNGSDKYTFFKKSDPFIKATIDGHMITSSGKTYILELKSTNDYDLVKAVTHFSNTGDFSDNPSMFKYYSQVQAGMYSTGIRQALLIVQYSGKSGVSISKAEISYSEEFITFILSKVKAYKEIVNNYLNGTSLSTTESAFKEMVDIKARESAYSYETLDFSEEEFSKIKEIKENYSGIFDKYYREYEEELSLVVPISSALKKNIIGITLNKILKIRKDESELDYRRKLIINLRKLRSA